MRKIYRKIVLGVTVIIAAFSYKKVIYACEESQLIKENVEALSLTEETPQQPDISTCVSAKNVICIALHPTDPSKDKEVANKKWPNK